MRWQGSFRSVSHNNIDVVKNTDPFLVTALVVARAVKAVNVVVSTLATAVAVVARAVAKAGRLAT
jgi:hypothetical protein